MFNGYLLAQVMNSTAPVAGRKKVRALPRHAAAAHAHAAHVMGKHASDGDEGEMEIERGHGHGHGHGLVHRQEVERDLRRVFRREF